MPELLAWHLPCDDTGQWFLKRRVPLFRYDYDKRRMLDLCLVVVLPDKRSGRARLTTEWLGADSQSVRMDATPEFFDARAIESFQANILRGKGRSANKQALQLWQLQTSGKFADACALVGLAMEDTIEDCLAQKRVSHMCTCCAELDEQLIAWSDLLKQTLLSLNLATLVPLLIRDQARRKQPRSDPIPILPFPMQRHTRKAHLAVDIRDPNQPRLVIDTTGSMNRVPSPIWKRPIEFDVLQYKLTEVSQFPEIVTEQFA